MFDVVLVFAVGEAWTYIMCFNPTSVRICILNVLSVPLPFAFASDSGIAYTLEGQYTAGEVSFLCVYYDMTV